MIENGPAGNAGVEIGDQLIKVNDSLVAGVNITSDRIIHLLKGKQRSNVYVTAKCASNGLLKRFPITRDIIPIHSVEASIMLNPVTGFIKINRFSANTDEEFKTALKKLMSQGARQLVLDLRGNPGGYIDAATGVANSFLDSNKLVVYTLGVHSPKTEYKASETGLFENGRLAVLVDESSASASEILAGAIQDWDRGVIIGRRTFGKGLVQEQYEMPDGSALRLTIAKYYTPAGRCIQRSFANGKEAYIEDYEKRFEDGELTGTDTTADVSDSTPFYTSKHRVVYGGGGIKPDVYVPYDAAATSGPLLTIIYSQELKTAIWDYFIHNRADLKFNNVADLDRSFNDQQQIVDGYMNMLNAAQKREVIKITSRPENDNYFRLQIKAQVARFLFRDNGYYAVSLKSDDMVNKALAILNSDKYSDIIRGN